MTLKAQTTSGWLISGTLRCRPILTECYTENPINGTGRNPHKHCLVHPLFRVYKNHFVSVWTYDYIAAMHRGAAMPKRAAIYVRVSTDKQTVDNQVRELRQIAERRGWEVVELYTDAGISGAKGRDMRPGLDQMLKDASKRRFDVVMAWAIDRLGRSLIDLLGTIQQHNLVAGLHQAFFYHHHIKAAATAGEKALDHIGAPKFQAELVAWHAWLADDYLSRADPEAVADLYVF